MTPQQKQQLEELAKWHEEEERGIASSSVRMLPSNRSGEAGIEILFHRNAAKLLREVVEL